MSSPLEKLEVWAKARDLDPNPNGATTLDKGRELDQTRELENRSRDSERSEVRDGEASGETGQV